MIGYLKGQVFDVTSENLVLNVSGVGYEVQTPLPMLAQMASLSATEKETQAVGLWIYTHVREDQITLFGFETRAEKQMFMTLLKVNGIGPKSALNILSGATFEKLQQMIDTGDVKGLTSLPKVGKKTAEQMILTLKGKLVSTENRSSQATGTHQEISFALVHLGFKPQDVDQVVAQLPREIDLQEGIRQGLQSLSSL
ncbi:MAG: Holliday junction branch migration protein RuvA [Proteobacteria bacterium]|jgi:Holliday junction DNA helicase RuvA|nr:Holliday junction branch migration protein RuvA [Pseudomonadota bacterium]